MNYHSQILVAGQSFLETKLKLQLVEVLSIGSVAKRFEHFITPLVFMRPTG